MSGTSTNRRTALGLPLGVLFASAVGWLRFGAVDALAAPPAKKPHARSKMMPYVDKRPFVLTIEHPDYDASSRVSHAEIWDSTSTHCLGHWLPFPDAKKGQKVKGNRITVVFDTSRLFPGPSPAPAALMPASVRPQSPPVPSKLMPASVPPAVTPVIGSGSIVVVSTNAPSDSPSTTDPIVLDPVDVDSCP